MTFRCQLDTATSTFFLLKGGRSSRPQLRYGNLRAEFHLGPVTPAHRGTYRCFGSYNNHAWSFPSKPVRLLVKGEDLPSMFPRVPSGSLSDQQRRGWQLRGRWGDAERVLCTSTLIHIDPQRSRCYRKHREMVDGGAGQGEETAGKTRPLDFLVSVARRRRGHHLRAH